jgi:hypothetical protein
MLNETSNSIELVNEFANAMYASSKSIKHNIVLIIIMLPRVSRSREVSDDTGQINLVPLIKLPLMKPEGNPASALFIITMLDSSLKADLHQ